MDACSEAGSRQNREVLPSLTVVVDESTADRICNRGDAFVIEPTASICQFPPPACERLLALILPLPGRPLKNTGHPLKDN